jgi:hypothetical protein
MSRLLAIAISLFLFASYATSQCQNAKMRSILYHCGCGGEILVTVCLGGGGQCDGIRTRIQCSGGCEIDGAGACLSSSVDKRGSPRPAILDGRLALNSASVSCSASARGSLEDWVNSRERSVR